ncbi:MAG: YbaK/EbsC family protein [Candidatus Nanopelagicaceae bacterium]|nr:YbaK/EbsC family protein [Candidatus Nanopelagicaceae bacterium]
MDGVLEKAAVQRAKAAITASGMKGEIKLLSDSARTAAEAAAALGIEVGQIASSLVFKLPNEKPLLVITSGGHRVDTELVAQYLQVPALGRADADFVKEISGYSVGGVAPIGWLNSPAITLIDLALDNYSEIWAAAGHPHTVFPTSFAELKQAANATPAQVGH